MAICPELENVTVSELQTHACGARPCPALAYYDRESQIIYLLDDLDFDKAAARGILLHEMVHYVQDVTDNWEQPNDTDECRASLQRELQAFYLQERYLAHLNVFMPVSRNMMFYSC